VGDMSTTKLLNAVDQFNEIARVAFADGNVVRGVKAIVLAAEYLRAARAMQRMHDVIADGC